MMKCVGGGFPDWTLLQGQSQKAKRQHMETIKTEKSFGWEITGDHQN